MFINKRPHPSSCPNPPVVRDPPPFEPPSGTKRSRASATVPLSSSVTGFAVSPPAREGSEGARTEDREVPDACWVCFCGSHTTNVVGLSAELLSKVAISTKDFPSANTEPSSAQTGDNIELLERTAEFYLHVRLEGNAFELYALFLKWVVNHKGPLCLCAWNLAHRARIGCARTALARTDLEVADVLLEQSKGLSPPAGSTEIWLLYESIFTWRLYSSREVLQLDGEKDAIRRLQTKFKSIKFPNDPTPYRTLGIITCYEILSVIPGRDAKLHMVDLELGERHDDCVSASPESPSQRIHPSDLTSCLRWMLDLPASRQSGQVPLLPQNPCDGRCNRIDSFNVNFWYYFSLCWAQLKYEMGSVPPPWFQNPKSMGIRSTELLAVMVHLVIEEASPNETIMSGAKQLQQVPIRNLLFLDESRLLNRFKEMRFNCTLVSSINQLSRDFCSWCAEDWVRVTQTALQRAQSRLALDPVLRVLPDPDTQVGSLADRDGFIPPPWSTTTDFSNVTGFMGVPLSCTSNTPRPRQHVTTSQPRHETAHYRDSTSAPYSMSPKNAGLPSSSMISTIPPGFLPLPPATARVLPHHSITLPPSTSQAKHPYFGPFIP